MDSIVCAVSLDVAENPKASVKDHEPPLPMMPFGILAYKFVGQLFSKQLCIVHDCVWYSFSHKGSVLAD